MSRRNPIDAAAELSEAWHGRPAKHITEVVEQLHVHSVLAEFALMEELEIIDESNARYAIPIRFGHDTILASSEFRVVNGEKVATSLYLVGGRQKVDLKPFGLIDDRDSLVLGQAFSITYNTAKFHLGKEDKKPGPYRHVFGEEGGVGPMITYDTMNDLLAFHGGTYAVKVDIDGKYSAGIRD